MYYCDLRTYLQQNHKKSFLHKYCKNTTKTMPCGDENVQFLLKSTRQYKNNKKRKTSLQVGIHTHYPLKENVNKIPFSHR